MVPVYSEQVQSKKNPVHRNNDVFKKLKTKAQRTIQGQLSSSPKLKNSKELRELF